MVTWGRREDCEHAAVFAAVSPLIPPGPARVASPFELSEPGRLEALLTQAGLTAEDSGQIASFFAWPDNETAWKAISSAGPTVMAVRYAGEEKVKQVVLASLRPFRTSDGGYRLENKYRYVIATR